MTSTPFRRPAAVRSVVEGRRPIATYATYEEAEEAVDYLADNHFPVERVSIVGHGVTLVEEVTGRSGWLDALVRGSLAGALAGVLIGWLFAVFNWYDPVVASGWLALDGLWFGALVGSAVGLLQRAVLGGRRDFDSVRRLGADRYEVVVDDAVADDAKRLLDQPGAPAAGSAPVTEGAGR